MATLTTSNPAFGFWGTIAQERDPEDAWEHAMQAIEAAVERWMGWRIGRRIERETGIPRDLPYLTGFVTHMEILADAA